jgi:hypothetical protein
MFNNTEVRSMGSEATKDYSILFDKMAEFQTESLIVHIEGLDTTNQELDEINSLRKIVESTMKKEQYHFTLSC